jgi:hypothetical protein
MSRGRPRHQASRRRAYHERQREVRERHVRTSREDELWMTADQGRSPEPDSDSDLGSWAGLRLSSRASA